jgi:predicted DNA-binding ribbon-helix-helix protein
MPVRESLGAALLRAGDAAGAEAVFREGMRRSVRNGRMLFGLMKSLEAQRKTEAVALVREEYEREWKDADVQLRIEDL